METADPMYTDSFSIPVTYYDMFWGKWNQEKTRHFMENTHLPNSLWITAAYLLIVKFGPMIMKYFQPFDLRFPLGAWNFALSFYSGLSFYILWPHFMKSYNKGGIIGTICYNDDLYTNPESGFWGWLFVMSKGAELFDTLFLILRKRPVIFLHWYHHSMTFLMGQIFYTEFVPWPRPGVLINLGVHTLMYFYYGLRAWGVKTDRWVSKMITIIQITQFISGSIFGFALLNGFIENRLEGCNTKMDKMFLGAVVVASYLYLFGQYFQETYLKKNAPAASEKVEGAEKKEETKKVQ